MKSTIFITIILVLFACNQTKDKSQVALRGNPEMNDRNCSSEYLAQAVLWYQRSPEMQALYLQSFAMAKIALANNLKHKSFPKKKNAVVVDIDETILNNSAYEGCLYVNNKTYSDSSWNAWVGDAKAEPLPGAVDFLKYVKKSGCEVFYVSNRSKETQTELTLQNLKKYDLPDADKEHLLFKTKGDTTLTGRTTKEKRRLKIENELNYEILLLCGDQVADFDKAFDIEKGLTENQIRDSITKYQDRFGKKYILLPNPMYNDWLNKNILATERETRCHILDSLRKSKVSKWK